MTYHSGDHLKRAFNHLEDAITELELHKIEYPEVDQKVKNLQELLLTELTKIDSIMVDTHSATQSGAI